MAALPSDDAGSPALAATRSRARRVLAALAAAMGQSQPGMFTVLSTREGILLALLWILACLPGHWRQVARSGAT